MFILSKYIRDNTDIKVVFSGEGSDEASGSYIYFYNAPNPQEFQKECIRLLNDLHLYDCLRADKCISSAGLEPRVPFLDREFIEAYMSIDPKLKMPTSFGIEKHLLRQAFLEDTKLPIEIIKRKKDAFSNAISKQERDWATIIKEYVNTQITDDEYNEKINEFIHMKPRTKEELYNRLEFEKYYNGRSETIPYYWMPKWVDEQTDPSARVLKLYSDIKVNENTN